MSKKYIYFISFNSNSIFCNCELIINEKIKSFDELQKIKKFIESTNDLENVL